MTDRQERDLDELLGTGRRSSDPAIDPLIEQADDVRKELSVLAPSGRRERALFVQGVGARSHPLLPMRFLIPAAAVVAGILVLAGFGRTAVPGQTLYPVREALASVGLTASAEEEIERRMDAARDDLRRAEDLLEDSPGPAQRLVLAAIGDLQRARALSDELNGEERSDYLEEMSEMEGWAVDMLTAASLGPDDQTEILDEDDSDEALDEDSDGDDNSGPGGDDSGGDDNSGSGSDDPGGGDSSGSGSGDDDDGGDDSSGSGSDDDSGGDDNSGSGSDDSGDDDSSGSGSGDDDDGGDDRSGSGGGDDDGGGDSSGSGSGGDSDDD